MTTSSSRSGAAAAGEGALTGALIGLCAKELELEILVSYWGDTTTLVAIAAACGAVVGLTSLARALRPIAAVLVVFWGVVAFTPLTHWMSEGLVRRDPLDEADAVYVLASGVQRDGELTEISTARLLGGLSIVGEGWAPRLILAELPSGPRYTDAARDLMTRLGIEHEILTVGPVRNTHDEAVAVAALVREKGFERVIVVTSPSHSERAARALLSEGIDVISRPSSENRYDYENLHLMDVPDDRVDAFGSLAHEWIGLYYYRMRGWIQ